VYPPKLGPRASLLFFLPACLPPSLPPPLPPSLPPPLPCSSSINAGPQPPPSPTKQYNTNDTKSCTAAGPNCAWVAKDAPSKAGKGRPAGCYSKARASATPEEVRRPAMTVCPFKLCAAPPTRVCNASRYFALPSRPPSLQFEAFLSKANAFDTAVVGTCDSMKALKTGTTTAKACSALTKKAECAAKADCAWSGSACAMSQTAMATLVGLPADILAKVKACAAKATSADCAAVGSFSVALAA
jgi:hypothetical protein